MFKTLGSKEEPFGHGIFIGKPGIGNGAKAFIETGIGGIGELIGDGRGKFEKFGKFGKLDTGWFAKFGRLEKLGRFEKFGRLATLGMFWMLGKLRDWHELRTDDRVGFVYGIGMFPRLGMVGRIGPMFPIWMYFDIEGCIWAVTI